MPGTLKVGGNIIASHTGVEGAGTVTLQNIFASTSDVQGNHKEGTITTGTNSLTVNNSTDILNGDYVVGEGIAPGTTVSSGEGTTTLTLSANVNASLSSAPVSFYHNNKALSAGTVAGGLCRAWVSFQADGEINSSFNVTSISNTSAGNYSIYYATNMPDTNYCVLSSLRNEDNTYPKNQFIVNAYTNYVAVKSGFNGALATFSLNNLYDGHYIAIFR